jgi:hypothetical protein
MPRPPARLHDLLQKQLNMYALAASAAGVGLLSAQPAEAKIVYTPAHAKVVQPVPMDLNHDGIVDFYLAVNPSVFNSRLEACQYLHSVSEGTFCSRSSRGTNAMRTIDSTGRVFGAALRYGEKIQHGEQFGKSRVLLGGVSRQAGGGTYWYGPWFDGGKGVKHRYLGLKFKIEGRLHFGWARITIATTSDTWTAILTGYAFETVPGKAIIAGATQDADDPEPTASVTTPTPEPASLGMLALGAPGLSIWKRESVGATQ